jgi:hypothetical protein
MQAVAMLRKRRGSMIDERLGKAELALQCQNGGLVGGLAGDNV